MDINYKPENLKKRIDKAQTQEEADRIAKLLMYKELLNLFKKRL